MSSFTQRYSTLQTLEICVPDMQEISVLPAIWKLDLEIRAKISPIIEQYQNGCLHSMEFMSALISIVECNKE